MGQGFVHFEIPAEDRQRARAFYGKLFGWAFEDVGGMEYTLVNTGGAVNGGIVKRSDDTPGIMNYIDVSDVADSLKRAEKIGATILRSRTPVPSIGWYAILKDTEGNTFALWQDDQNAGF